MPGEPTCPPPPLVPALQVLGVGSDSGVIVPSVLLFFDRQRYLFNVGEGFQRFCTDHKVKLSKVGHVLMTRVTTEASGGLPGARRYAALWPPAAAGGRRGGDPERASRLQRAACVGQPVPAFLPPPGTGAWHKTLLHMCTLS